MDRLRGLFVPRSRLLLCRAEGIAPPPRQPHAGESGAEQRQRDRLWDQEGALDLCDVVLVSGDAEEAIGRDEQKLVERSHEVDVDELAVGKFELRKVGKAGVIGSLEMERPDIDHQRQAGVGRRRQNFVADAGQQPGIVRGAD